MKSGRTDGRGADHRTEQDDRPPIRGRLGGGSLALLDELAHPDLAVSYPAMGETLRGVEVFREALTRWRAAFADADRTDDAVIAEGDQVVISWTFRGTHRGDFMGIPPTGRAVRLTGVTTYRIDNGRILEERGVSDALGLVRQLGAFPGCSAR